MPNIPETKQLTANQAQVLNAIRNSASPEYQNLVPIADIEDIKSLRGIGDAIMQYVALKNEFLNALVNRIGMVIMNFKMFNNPWSMFKRGLLEFGETIEEIFVALAKPHEYDPEVAETQVFKRENPDVSAVFHRLNYKKFYKVTINNDQLRQAFLSWSGITELIARIVDSLYGGAEYDEFQTMKYMIALAILRGEFTPVQTAAVSQANMKTIAADLKGISNILEFPSVGYNEMGVLTFSRKDTQYLISNAKFDATMDVEVLASAFNMEKAEFMGHRVLVDGFGKLDVTRLNELFADDPSYVQLTETQLSSLEAIPAVLVDREWFMIFDNMYQFTEIYNAEGLYWNYFYHVWKTFSHSPFQTAVCFVTGEPSVTSVTVSPATATVAAGQTLQLSVDVTTANFAPKSVTYASDNANVYVSDTGLVTVDTNATGTANITVTSTFDATKTATSKITIS